jgi:polyisoprenoid-binding protein YceI
MLIVAAGPGRAAWSQSPRGSADDVNIEYSRVTIFVDKVGFGHQHAVDGLVKEGKIRLGAASDAGSLVFDMASFVADTTEGRRRLKLEGETDAATQKQVTANMLGKDVLDAARYPTATFEIESAAPLPEKSSQGNPQYVLEGKFTLHATTRPLRVRAEALDEGNWLHLRGGFYLKQREFGIKPFTKAFGAVGVADQLTFYGDFFFAK